MSTLDDYQAELLELEAQYKKEIGGQGIQNVTRDGKSITYRSPNIAKLEARIEMLKRKIGARKNRWGPARVTL